MDKHRRHWLLQTAALPLAASSLAASAGVDGAAAANATPARLIAVEEGFTIPEIASRIPSVLRADPAREPGEAAVYGITQTSAMAGSGGPAAGPPPWMRRIGDLGAGRLADMDASGIDLQLLLLSSPGVQVFTADEGTELAALANDRLAAAVVAHPTRFAGLAAVAPQDARRAALELERAIGRLGLKGAVINSHTGGEYLDAPRFRPLLEAAAALRVPIYLHPRAPSPGTVGGYLDHGLVGAIWGYAAETGLHALRLIFSGIFDELPHLRFVVGHLGEGIPFFLDRLDTHYLAGGGRGPRSAKLRRMPSDYFREHFVVTTSGMNWGPALRCTLDALGADRVLYAADYPFEDLPREARRFRELVLTPQERGALAHRNAERVFGLATGG